MRGGLHESASCSASGDSRWLLILNFELEKKSAGGSACATKAVFAAWRNWRLRRRGLMGAEEGMDWAHGQGDAVLGLLPREHAYFGFGRGHGGFHGYGVWMRGDIIGQDQIKDGWGFLVVLSGLQVEPAPVARNDNVKLKPKRNAGTHFCRQVSAGLGSQIPPGA